MSAITLRGLDHVVLRVTDMERAKRFYCDVLGCSVAKERPDLGLIHLKAGRSMIDLSIVDGLRGKEGGAPPGKEGRNVDHFALQIESFDEAALRAELAKHGVGVDLVAKRFGAEGTGMSLYLYDPDGNKVELKGPSEGP